MNTSAKPWNNPAPTFCNAAFDVLMYIKEILMYILSISVTMRNIFFGICIFFTIIFVMSISIFLANLVPSQRILENVRETIYTENYVQTPFGKGDQFTECVALTMGLPPVETGYSGPLGQSILSPTYWDCEAFKKAGGDDETITEYWRYWHGYQVVTRPLLFFTGVGSLQWIAFFGFVASVGFFFFQVIKLKSFAIILASVSCLLFPLYTKLFYIVHAFDWVIAFISAGLAIAISFRSKPFTIDAYCFSALIVGMITAFFDMLTNPILTLALPLVAILWSCRPGDAFTEQRTWRFVLLSGVWSIGYFGCWTTKWTIVSILTDENVFEQVRETIAYRLSGDYGASSATILWSIKKNINLVRFGWILLSLLLAIGILRAFIALLKNRANLDSIMSVAFIFMLPFGWLAVAKNHSIIHAAYVAPILFPSFALLTSICLSKSTVFESRPCRTSLD